MNIADSPPGTGPDPALPLTPGTALALLSLLVAIWAFSLFDSSYLHPGYSGWDDYGNLYLLQAHREGVPLIWSFARGCWHRLACALSLQANGPSLYAIRLPALLGLGVEAFALATLASRLFGPRAAFWAGAAVLASAQAMLRGRSLLAYSLWPAELAVMLALIPVLRKPWQSFSWSLAAGLLLFDYEGWAVSLPALALAWRALAPDRRHGGHTLTGFAAGTLIVLALSLPNLPSWWSTRQMGTVLPHASQWLGQGLRSLHSIFWGGPAMIFLGMPGHPLVAWWVLPLSVLGGLGQWRGRPWLWLGVLLGLGPIFLNNTHAEPQRLLSIEVFACLLAGAGAVRIQERISNWRWLLGLGLGLGIFVEGNALLKAMAATYGRDLAVGRHQQMGLSQLAQKLAGRPVQLITELGHESAAPVRLLAEASGIRMDAQAADAVAAVPWTYVHALRADTGLRSLPRLEVGDRKDGPGMVFIACDPAARSRLLAIEAVLRPLWHQTLNLAPRLAWPAYKAALAQAPADPWLRTALCEAWIDKATYVNDFTPADVMAVLALPMISGQGYQRLGEYLQGRDPALALRCALRSVEADPGQVEPFLLAARLMLKLGQKEPLARLRRQFERAHPDLEMQFDASGS